MLLANKFAVAGRPALRFIHTGGLCRERETSARDIGDRRKFFSEEKTAKIQQIKKTLPRVT
jgi:hypothetical protein